MENKQDNLKDFNWKDFEKKAIEGLYEGKSFTGTDGVLTPLIKRILEASLKGELKEHVDPLDEKRLIRWIIYRIEKKTSKK